MSTKIVQGSSHSKISVDSLKIRIPFSDVKVIDENLTDKWILYNPATGEQDETYFKENSLCKSDKGISVRFAIEEQMTANKTKETYLTMLLPSKILKEKYFEGITEHNIDKVYDELMSYEVVSFSLDTFLHRSACTDVDFKKDSVCNAFESIIKGLSNSAIPSKKKNEGYRSFNKKNNQGIEFSDRRTTAYKSNPYLKLYNKELQLTYDSNVFANEYLKNINYTNVIRIETTVKNKKHFKHLGINDTSLHSILSISNEVKEQIISKAIQKHIEPRTRQINTPNELTPSDMIIHNAIVLLLDSGMSYENIKRQLTSSIKSSPTKSRKRKEMDLIYQHHIKNTDVDKTAKEINQFYDWMGWK